MGEVDLTAEVVAVAVDGGAAVNPDPRLRALVEAAEEFDRPLGQRAGVGGDDHHLVADRLHDRRLARQRGLDPGDEALDHVERLDVALLLGVAGEAGEVDEAERDVDLAQFDFRRVATGLGLHVADHVLLDVEAQVAVVQVLGQRRGQRHHVSRQVPHFLGHLQLGDAVADQRLVDVEVEQPHLGVGDAADRLHVYTDQLQEGDQWEARCQHPGAEPQGDGVLGGEVALAALRRPHHHQDPLDQLGLEPGFAGDHRDRDLALVFGEELFGEAEGEPTLAAGAL
jgi:hypothetical protein